MRLWAFYLLYSDYISFHHHCSTCSQQTRINKRCAHTCLRFVIYWTVCICSGYKKRIHPFEWWSKLVTYKQYTQFSTRSITSDNAHQVVIETQKVWHYANELTLFNLQSTHLRRIQSLDSDVFHLTVSYLSDLSNTIVRQHSLLSPWVASSFQWTTLCPQSNTNHFGNFEKFKLHANCEWVNVFT